MAKWESNWKHKFWKHQHHNSVANNHANHGNARPISNLRLREFAWVCSKHGGCLSGRVYRARLSFALICQDSMPSGPIICQASIATGQKGATMADGGGTARGGAAAGATAGEGGAAVSAAPQRLSTSFNTTVSVRIWLELETGTGTKDVWYSVIIFKYVLVTQWSWFLGKHGQISRIHF